MRPHHEMQVFFSTPKGELTHTTSVVANYGNARRFLRWPDTLATALPEQSSTRTRTAPGSAQSRAFSQDAVG